MLLRTEVDALRELIERYRQWARLLDDESGREAAAAVDSALKAVLRADGGTLAREDARVALEHAHAVLGRSLTH